MNRNWIHKVNQGEPSLTKVKHIAKRLSNIRLSNIRLDTSGTATSDITLSNIRPSIIRLSNIRLSNIRLHNIRLSNIGLSNIMLRNIRLCSIRLGLVVLGLEISHLIDFWSCLNSITGNTVTGKQKWCYAKLLRRELWTLGTKDFQL